MINQSDMSSRPAELVAFALLAIRLLGSLWLPGVFLWLAGIGNRLPAVSRHSLRHGLAAIHIILLGTLWFLAGGLLLAVAGRLSAGSLLFSGMIPAVATVIRWRRRPEDLSPVSIWLSLLGVLGITTVVILIPHPGEWLVGGWDPGVYLNQGAIIARNGSIRFQGPDYLNALSAEGFHLFTRGSGSYRELFPGCAVDPATRRPLLYFFPLTPVAAALLDTLGGLPLLIRTGWFFGLLAPLFFLAALLGMGFRFPAALLGTAVLCLHPLFLYHLHVPVSETLQLTLLCSLALVSTSRRRAGWICLILLLLVINRLTFFVFGALWLALQCIEGHRLPVRNIILYAAALVAGAALDRYLAAATFLRRAADCRLAVAAGGVLLVSAIPLYMVGRYSSQRKPDGVPHFPALLIFLGIAVVLVVKRGFHSLAAIPQRAAVLLAFSGPWVTLAAAAGLVWVCFAFRRKTVEQSARLWVLFTSAVMLVLLGYPAIANIYPWALRRYMPYFMIAVGLGVAVLVHKMSSTRSRTITILAVTLCLGFQAPLSVRAACSTEYDGLLAILSRIARHITARDIVIADHPKWGTPLAYVFARNVLDGRRLWRHPEPQRLDAACRELNNLREAGFRVLFLCHDEEGLRVYPLSFDKDRLLTEVSFAFREVVQHPRIRTWKTRNRKITFRLYEVTSCRPAPHPRRAL